MKKDVMENTELRPHPDIWRSCRHCSHLHFDTATDFQRHLREKHTIKEGSMILCNYGQNGICSTLQFGDLSEAGYKCHLRQYHLTSDTELQHWNFFCSNQNLPAVLNDPNRGKQSNFFTKTWGEGFVEKYDIEPSAYLPTITLSHFEPYCKKISKRLRKHSRLKENANVKPQQNLSEDVCEIPKIFYNQSLELKNIEVFQKVFPKLCDSADPMASARNLQENLSNYLDTIEMKISKQVSQKSEAFFHAMLSHDTIMEQMSSAINLVKTTREKIICTDEALAKRPLEIVKLTKCQKSYNEIFDKLKLMATVQQTQPMIQLLLSTSDYVAALDLISSTQKVLSSQLTGILAFRHLSPQLTEMERLIDKMLNSEFQRFAMTDLNRPLTDTTEMPEKDKLISIVSGILRLRESEFIDMFKAEAVTTIQSTLKQLMIEIISQRDGNAEIVLRGSGADNAWLLSNEGILFLRRASPQMLTLLRRISAIHNLILEVSQMDNFGLTSEEEELQRNQEHIQEKLRKMIVYLSDFCNERCANLLAPKSENENILTNFNELTTLSKLIDDFSMQCENITGHCSNKLKLTLKSFAMKFMQNMHNDKRTQLTNMINTERWKVADVPHELQNVVNEIVKCDGIPSNITLEKSDKNSKFLLINNECFATVETVHLLIRILLVYCDVVSKSPELVHYISHCILELVRLFNSRCCQLVLGAGALQSAGLKTITTSNLAIVSRSLQVILWLLPLVKRFLSSIDSNNKNFTSFDIVMTDIESHKTEIENKINNIVSSLLISQLGGWDARPPVPSQTFRSISKHLVKLHEALSNILPLAQIRCIYKKVHDNFKDKLRDQLVAMNIVANGGPQHGVVTSELTFYLQTLKTLKVIADNEDEDNILYDIWIK